MTCCIFLTNLAAPVHGPASRIHQQDKQAQILNSFISLSIHKILKEIFIPQSSINCKKYEGTPNVVPSFLLVHLHKFLRPTKWCSKSKVASCLHLVAPTRRSADSIRVRVHSGQFDCCVVILPGRINPQQFLCGTLSKSRARRNACFRGKCNCASWVQVHTLDTRNCVFGT